jgi:hypothetical protein
VRRVGLHPPPSHAELVLQTNIQHALLALSPAKLSLHGEFSAPSSPAEQRRDATTCFATPSLPAQWHALSFPAGVPFISSSAALLTGAGSLQEQASPHHPFLLSEVVLPVSPVLFHPICVRSRPFSASIVAQHISTPPRLFAVHSLPCCRGSDPSNPDAADRTRSSQSVLAASGLSFCRRLYPA